MSARPFRCHACCTGLFKQRLGNRPASGGLERRAIPACSQFSVQCFAEGTPATVPACGGNSAEPLSTALHRHMAERNAKRISSLRKWNGKPHDNRESFALNPWKNVNGVVAGFDSRRLHQFEISAEPYAVDLRRLF